VFVVDEGRGVGLKRRVVIRDGCWNTFKILAISERHWPKFDSGCYLHFVLRLMNVQDILAFSGYPTCTIKLTFLSVLRLRDDTDMVPSL
jgi:hypothetical protein